MKKKGWARKYLQQNFDLYLLLLPALIYVFIFHLLPMVGILIAFKDYNMFQVPGDPFRSILESPWAGFKYFEQVFKKSEFQQAFANTLIISLYKIIFTFPLPIIFAVFLNEVRSTKFQRACSSSFICPTFFPGSSSTAFSFRSSALRASSTPLSHRLDSSLSAF